MCCYFLPFVLSFEETGGEAVRNSMDEVLETAVDAGHILLESGAEIFRVEETMRRICRYFGVDESHEEFFVLANGLFATGTTEKGHFAKVKQSRVTGARLSKVVAINQMSRQIEQGKYTLPEVKRELERIRNIPEPPKWLQILSAGLGSAAFCCMFGGGPVDCAASFLAGLVLYTFVLYVSAPHMSKISGNLLGGALATVVCLLCYKVGFGRDLGHMIIGGIIPLVPGLAFTNGIRDIADGDYISGAVRLLDALLVFLCIAVGVGMVFTVYRHILGGVPL